MEINSSSGYLTARLLHTEPLLDAMATSISQISRHSGSLRCPISPQLSRYSAPSVSLTNTSGVVRISRGGQRHGRSQAKTEKRGTSGSEQHYRSGLGITALIGGSAEDVRQERTSW